MRTALIGHTGFVGGNLARQFSYDALYNSSNIQEIDGQEFDLLVCSGVRAVKWWANQNPETDLAQINGLLGHLRCVRSRETILISTIDVYPVPSGVDEQTPIEGLPNHAYGRHRLYLEQQLREHFPLLRVVRLPGLFGAGLKKNVIYDLIHGNGLEAINPDSVFQYYDLGCLNRDLAIVRQQEFPLVNFATRPIPTRDILRRFFPGVSVGQKAASQACYDMRTLHATSFGGSDGYLYDAVNVLDQLGVFLGSQTSS